MDGIFSPLIHSEHHKGDDNLSLNFELATKYITKMASIGIDDGVVRSKQQQQLQKKQTEG